MRISAIVVPLIVISCLAIFVGRLVIRRANAAKWRISIRGMLTAFTLIAILLATIVVYRRETMVQVRWIPTAQQAKLEAAQSQQVTLNSDDEYEFTYQAKRRRIQQLLSSLLPITDGGHVRVTTNSPCQMVKVSTSSEAEAKQQLANLEAADTLQPTVFVIRGRVLDSSGNPLVGATVDLMGDYVFINHFQTREDGTFTMPLTDGNSNAPPGGGYYLRIRASDDESDVPARWNSSSFSLNADAPELVLEAVVPRD